MQLDALSELTMSGEVNHQFCQRQGLLPYNPIKQSCKTVFVGGFTSGLENWLEDLNKFFEKMEINQPRVFGFCGHASKAEEATEWVADWQGRM